MQNNKSKMLRVDEEVRDLLLQIKAIEGHKSISSVLKKYLPQREEIYARAVVLAD